MKLISLILSILILVSCETIVEPSCSTIIQDQEIWTSVQEVTKLNTTYIDSIFESTATRISVDSLLVDLHNVRFRYLKNNRWYIIDGFNSYKE